MRDAVQETGPHQHSLDDAAHGMRPAAARCRCAYRRAGCGQLRYLQLCQRGWYATLASRDAPAGQD